MAGNDQVDQDAIAAQWEASLDSADPAKDAAEAEANELSENMALQWAAMVEDGSRDFGTTKNSGERVLSQSETAAYDRGGSPTIVFNVKDAASVRQSRSQIAADAARAVAMGRRNS